MNKTLLITIAVVVILLGGFFTYQYFSEKPNNPSQIQNDQTAGWKTYTNSKYGLTFKLPENFVGSILNDDPYLFSFHTEGSSQTLLGTIEKRYGAYSNVSEIFVGGVKSYKGEPSTNCDQGCNSHMPIFIPLDNDRSIELGFAKFGETIKEATISQEDESLITKILSTFKFTK